MSSPPSKPSFFQWIMGVKASENVDKSTSNSVRDLVKCDRCGELVLEDDMYKRRRRGKTKVGKYCRECGKKGYRPPVRFNEEC
jgi:formylmethanofuran dehydrogenase subunit E